MSQEVIDKFFADTAEAETNKRRPPHNRRHFRNAFLKKEKYATGLDRRRRHYVDNAKLALERIDVILARKRTESNVCRCVLLARTGNEVLVDVWNKVNNTKSVSRLYFRRGRWYDGDYLIHGNGAWNPIYYKRYFKNTSGMKRFANKHVRHSKCYCIDAGTGEREETRPSPGWHRRVFEPYDICDF